MLKLNRILLPTDFSSYSQEATQYACGFVEKFDAQLHLMHVLEKLPSTTPAFGGGLALSSYVKESRQAAEKAMSQILDPDWHESHEVVCSIEEGTPFLAILRYAKQNDIDLIVMGTHGHSGLAHVLMGSVAERVVRKASCPVLTVRPSGHEFVMP